MSWRPLREDLEGGPTYLALAARLEADIARGVLAPGTRLPPQRELADFLDLNFTTVTRAYEVCREKGLIYGVVGRGTFVAEQGLQSATGDVVDCSVVEYFPGVGGDLLSQASEAVMSRGSFAQLFSYAARDGWPHHRRAGVQWLARAGVGVAVERLSVFPGVQSALSTVLLSLFRVGDALAVDRQTYSNLIHLARLAHVRLVAVDGDLGGMLPDALAEAVRRNRRIRGVFLMPQCANPTTITLSESRKDALAAVADAANLIVLEDDVRSDPPSPGRKTLFARIPERTVYLSGVARVIAPGLRVAYVACPTSFAAQIQAAFHHLTIKASALEAELLSELVTSGAADRILELKRKRAIAANAVFDEIFGSDGGDPTRMFRRLSYPDTAGRGQEAEAAFRARGVAICHSDRFAVCPGDAASFLRVSVSSAGNLARLRRGLTRLRAGLGG